MKTMCSTYHSALCIGLICSVLLFGIPQGARGAVVDCSSGNVACLINAINMANASSVGTTINLKAGTYTLRAVGSGDIFGGSNGLPPITSNITINGTGANSTVIERAPGVRDFRIFFVATNGTLILNGLTIKGGSAFDGGGIFNIGTVTITNSTISDNTASNGGGINNGSEFNETMSGDLRLTNSIVSGNMATARGGGIQNVQGTVRLTNTIVSNNTVGNMITGSTGVGGGISNQRGIMRLIESTVSGNSAFRNGGGVINGTNGTLTLIDSAISGNTVTGLFSDGGGILNVTGGIVTLINSTVSGNMVTGSDGSGGGIHNGGGELRLTNVTVSGNTVTNPQSSFISGGGIFSNGTATLNNVTITMNTAPGAVSGFSTGFSENENTANISNTIIAQNTGNSDCGGTFNSLGFNLIGNILGCNGFGVRGDRVGNPANPINAMLGPLQNNGGFTQTHALLPGSPAIDMGNPVRLGIGGSTCESTDQRGLFRPANGDRTGEPVCDIGAFELGATSEPPPLPPECSDRTDNDGDRKVDLADPGCSSPNDDSESPDPPQCSDRTDNDGDRKVDLADPGCSSPNDDSESPDPPPMQFTFICPLLKFIPFQGNIFYVPEGRICGGGFVQGTVISIRNTRLFSMAFLKPGKTNSDCRNPQAVVVVGPGEVFGATGMQQLFGTSSPQLPIAPVGCPLGVDPRNLPDRIGLDIDYRGNQ